MASLINHYREGPYRDFAQEHHDGGTFGLNLFQIDQGAGEFVDPAVAEFAIYTLTRPCDPFETNFGDGWKKFETHGRIIDVQPAHTECAFRLPELDLQVAVIDESRLSELLHRHVLTPGDLGNVTERCRALPQAIAAHDAMWAAANRSDPAASLDLDGAFLTMMGELIAACGHGLPPAPKLDDRRLTRAVDYAETHIAASLTVGELARVAAMSPSAFSRTFRAATGETPWAYVRRRRLERAGERLARTDDTLADIAAECGFADASHLARCWKAAHGTTPRGDTS